MNYTLMIASHDYGCIGLDKCGNKYHVYAYIGGYGCTTLETYSTYDEAEMRFFEMCKNSHVTPHKVEHDIDNLIALTAD